MGAGCGVEAKHLEVTGKAAGPDAPVEAAACLMVELGDSLRQHERVVIGHARHAGAEDNVLGLRQGHGDEQIGGRDVFPHGGEMLTDPGLLVAELVEHDDLLQVVLEGAGQVGAGRMQGHCEVSDFHGGLLD